MAGVRRSQGSGVSVFMSVGDQYFAPLVSSRLKLVAEFDVLFLRPGMGGVLTGQGDIDNRLKALFDGLSVPRLQMAASAPCSPGFGVRVAPLTRSLRTTAW
jgi:hypothetical protein